MTFGGLYTHQKKRFFIHMFTSVAPVNNLHIFEIEKNIISKFHYESNHNKSCFVLLLQDEK